MPGSARNGLSHSRPLLASRTRLRTVRACAHRLVTGAHSHLLCASHTRLSICSWWGRTRGARLGRRPSPGGRCLLPAQLGHGPRIPAAFPLSAAPTLQPLCRGRQSRPQTPQFRYGRWARLRTTERRCSTRSRQKNCGRLTFLEGEPVRGEREERARGEKGHWWPPTLQCHTFINCRWALVACRFSCLCAGRTHTRTVGLLQYLSLIHI